MNVASAAAFAIAAATIAGMLARPWGTREWMWAVTGAVCVLAVGAVSPREAWNAVAGGFEIYLFLIGILALAELARLHDVFVWLSGLSLRLAGGSQTRLFALIFFVGVGVTALLSNDTTVIVLTPAALAILARTNAPRLPYLYACAFVSNAASYVLPISNPANLIVFAGALPSLGPWLNAFALSAVVAVAVTFGVLYAVVRRQIGGPLVASGASVALTRAGRVTCVALVAGALALVVANVAGASVGAVAFACAVLATLAVTIPDRRTPALVARRLRWEVVPLVAGLFVIVAALERTGAVAIARVALLSIAHWPLWAASLAIGSATTIACNLLNNLPVALFAGATVHDAAVPAHVANVALVAIDLGPNLSLTGSLATLLWLIVLRRDGIEVTAWQFFRLGVVVTVPALALALLTVR